MKIKLINVEPQTVDYAQIEIQVMGRIVTRLPQLFRMMREELGRSQVEISKAMKTTQGRLSKIERGLLEPSASELVFLMRNMGPNTNELLNRILMGER